MQKQSIEDILSSEPLLVGTFQASFHVRSRHGTDCGDYADV